MHYCKPAGLLDRFHERELNELKAVTVHSELATAAALDYCAREEICPPPWVVQKAADLMCDLLKREKAQKRGRAAGHIARYRQDLWDLERFDAILEIRRLRDRARSDVKIARSFGRKFQKSKRYEHIKKRRDWYRYGTLQCASMYLTGRDAKAGVDAMKASYQRVCRNTDGKTVADQYYLFNEPFLRKIGIPGLADRKPGTKWFPLYNLTP